MTTIIFDIIILIILTAELMMIYCRVNRFGEVIKRLFLNSMNSIFISIDNEVYTDKISESEADILRKSVVTKTMKCSSFWNILVIILRCFIAVTVVTVVWMTAQCVIWHKICSFFVIAEIVQCVMFVVIYFVSRHLYLVHFNYLNEWRERCGKLKLPLIW